MSISDRDIQTAVSWMRAADHDTIITPGKVYRALGKRPDCGGCLPHFVATMASCGSFEVPKELCGLRQRKGARDEGRREGP